MFVRALSVGGLVCVLAATVALAQAAPAKPKVEAAQAELPPQTVLPPGLYLFQTRTREGTCDDAQRTGYVTSAMATLDGVPGSRAMTMKLLNSQYWPTWNIEVAADDTITGYAVMGGGQDEAKGVSRFEIRAKKDRFQGVGSRTYPSKRSETGTCTLYYDALLKLLD